MDFLTAAAQGSIHSFVFRTQPESNHSEKPSCRESLRAGHSAKEIIEWFKYPKTMVYDLAKAYKAWDEKDHFTPDRKVHKLFD